MDDDTPAMTVGQSRSLAVDAHADQRDRDGSLHIDHVARVAGAVRADEALQRVAWLHDVLEDCDVTSADLRRALPRAEVEAVVLLTHDDDRDAYADYVQRIIDAPGPAGELARAVKEADMLDNLRRCARDRDAALAQYADALARLWTARPPQAPTPGSLNAAPITIKGVCLDGDGRVLLGRNDRGEWELPGGRPSVSESFVGCVVREIAEETGLRVTVSDLISAEPFEVIPGRWVNAVIYSCDLLDGGQPISSDEHERVAFLDVASLAAGELPDVYRRAVDRRIGSRR